MYRVHMERNIAVSHQLKLHEGKCSKLHGHNLKVEVDIESNDIIETESSSNGMVIDFGHLKKEIDRLDHTHLNEYFNNYSNNKDNNGLVIQPTAERVAKFLAKRIEGYQGDIEFTKIVVRVHEAEGQWAEFIIQGE